MTDRESDMREKMRDEMLADQWVEDHEEEDE